MRNFFADFYRIIKHHKIKGILKLLFDRVFNKRIEISIQLKSIITCSPNWGITKLNIPLVWQVTKGENIKVLVLDTGIDIEHSDLKEGVKAAIDFTPELNPRDQHGHGTHVAGIIGARGTNKNSMIGTAPKCLLYSGKVLNSQGSGELNWLINAIYWAIDNKIDIINMSLGFKYPYEPLRKALKKAYDKGIILIAAAGNDGNLKNVDNIGYPANYEEVIAVGALNENMTPAFFSSRGLELDIMAPGQEMYSTFPNNRYAVLSGTSQATPMVSGICALILAKHRSNMNKTPINNNKDMLEHLKKISIDIGPNGWDPQSGWGIIDPQRILTLSKGG